MIHCRGNPGTAGMTCPAEISRLQVGILFSGCICPIMAASTGIAIDTTVIKGGRQPGGDHMALTTLSGGIYMPRPLARGLGSIVTSAALRTGIGMIHIGRQPGSGGMTRPTLIPGLHVSIGLAHWIQPCSAMTYGAADTILVAIVNRAPGGILVTTATIQIRGDVAGRSSGGAGTVVTGLAGAGGVGVIESRRCPDYSGMAVLTLKTPYIHMARGKTRYTGCSIVVATRTGAQYCIVIYICYRERGSDVTGVAVVGTGDMPGRLPLGDLSIVTADTLCWCAFKSRAKVTCVTICSFVLTGQQKTS